MVKRRAFLLTSRSEGRLGLLSALSAQTLPRITFLNSGESVEQGTGPFWRMVSQHMSAANSLGMQLIYSERDHLLILRQAEGLARLSDPPDCIRSVSRKRAAQQMIAKLALSRANFFPLHIDLTPEQHRESCNGSEHIAIWIWTATIASSRGANFLMEYLHHRLGDREPQFIGITGDLRMPVSMESERVARYQAIVFNQVEALEFRLYTKAFSNRPGSHDFKLKRLLDIPLRDEFSAPC